MQPEDEFDALRTLATAISLPTSREVAKVARDVLILMLDRETEGSPSRAVLDSLAAAAGLYPYADPTSLAPTELLELEAHRPSGIDDVVFHSVQTSVYNSLMDGRSVVLSAPTSFGKSLIIDAVIASGKLNNVAIIVPTIALIDETRRRLSRRFGDDYKIVTHPGQELRSRNLLVMTQERVLDVAELPDLDLFVIDEFYKLDPTSDSTGRAGLLNQAFHRLRSTGSPFYLLGPNIDGVPLELDELAHVIVTDFSTVALDVKDVAPGPSPLASLQRLIAPFTDPTLIFCKSPKSARTVALHLIEARSRRDEATVSQVVAAAADWTANQYHPEWSFVRALRAGIGIHHGRIPRSLGQLAVRLFNSGELDSLVCTSTLIEGVNTSAKNVVMFDNRIKNTKLDYFTFNNIKGRSGPMFSHFVGHVYVFHEAPEPGSTNVDIPILTQSDAADRSMLVHLDSDDLTERSLELMQPIFQQDAVSVDELRAEPGTDPAMLLELHERLTEATSRRRTLSWTGFPSYKELSATCETIWEWLNGSGHSSSYVRSHKQLAYRLNGLRFDGIDEMLSAAVDEGGDPDEAVEDVLNFLRQWAGFHFPRLLMILEHAVNRASEALGEPRVASYGFYASKVESLFLARSLVALEEYGLPIQIGRKLTQVANLDDSLDVAIAELKGLEVESLELSSFEAAVLEDVRAHL